MERRGVNAFGWCAGISCRSDVCTGSFSMQHSGAGDTAGICGNLTGPCAGWGLAAYLHIWVSVIVDATARALRNCKNFKFSLSCFFVVMFCVSHRYVVPLLIAATFAGTLKQVLAMRQWSAWITPASGVLLLSSGTYTLLSRIVR